MRKALLIFLLAAATCHADEDEAWLRRADVPAGTRPLLAVLLDRSASTSAAIDVAATFDPQVDYGTGLAAETRCDPRKFYLRRGPGPAPACSPETTIDDLACDAARAPLAAYGFFVASPAVATVCHGARATPLVDAHVVYSGNFLNYLQSDPPRVAQPWSVAVAGRLADALAATAELDVALFVTDDDGPSGGYLALAPAANEAAASSLRTLAATPPAGDAALAGSLEEAARWLRGDTPGSGPYRSPFDSACRPVSMAVLTPTDVLDDEAALAAELGATDLRDDLPGVQSAPVAWSALSDSLAGANLVAAAFQHDAAVPGDPQLSAPGWIPSDADAAGAGVIFGLTAPRARARWLGNFLRYGLRPPASPLEPPQVVDRDREPAIDPASGLPFPHTRSLWSDAPDANLLAGGAASRLPPADARRILSDAADSVEVPPALGDPGRHAPLVVADEDSGRSFVLAGTQDGLLHAFDADSGVEQWAWIPEELRPRLPELMRDEPMFARSHGIDGALVLHERATGDGHRWLLFGLGRGGARYYTLDLERIGDPRLAWSFGLPDAHVQARGEPVVTRLGIAGSGQSAGNWVVLLPGGYDTRFDAPDATAIGAGGTLLVVDAESGRLLWSLDGFTSLPSAPRALDLDGDGDLDRAYLIDVTGNLWRIDFASGAAAADLAVARRIARLGTGAHRFFATPDVAVVQRGADTRLAIAVGSGALTRPRDTSQVDRIYVLFDSLTGTPPVEVEESELFDATAGTAALPADARGWFFRLEENGAGEKVIGPTVSFDHALRFQTYQPLPPDADKPCGPPRGVTRRYALDLRTALPRNTAAESVDEEPDEVAASGLPPPLRFGFDTRWQEPCDGCIPRPFGMTGGATFDPGYAGDPVRTSWRKRIPPPASP
jgi:outer membrane protein assembly factor BamB